MSRARPAVAMLIALAALASAAASAQQTQAKDEPGANAARPQQQDARKATPASKPVQRRRSVQQIIATVPPPAVAPSYGPVLTLPPPAPAPAGVPPVYPPPPAQVGACTGGQCMDAAGNTYNTGIGNSGVNSQGRLCTRTGTTVQCF